MALETDSRLDVVAPSWRGAVLGAGDTCCWSDRPLRRPRYLLTTIAQTTPFVEGNRYRRYPHDARDAVADTHAPGFQPEAPAGRSHAGVPRGPRSTKPGARPPGWHKRSNMLKLFTKVRAAQGPWPCCTRSGWPRRMRRRTSLLTGSSPPTEPSTPRRSSGHFLAFSNRMPPRVMGLCLAKFERCQVSNASILMEAGICFHACWCR